MTSLLAQSRMTKPLEAYLSLREQIIEGRIVPGTHLKLRPIAESLGISVGSVSEALRALAHEGLVELEPHYGARVRKFDAEALWNQHIFRIAVECESVRRCTQRISDLQLNDLMKQAREVDRLVDVQGKVMEAREKDGEFHLTIARLSGVAKLVQALETAQLHRLVAVDSPPDIDMPIANRTHVDLVKAIKTRDVDQAEQAMREHCETSMKLHLRNNFG